jgi:hypothetical protein
MVKVWDNVTGIYNTMPLSTLSIGGYNGGAWTLFTCTATPQSGTITTQSSTSSYTQIGKIVFLQITVSIPNVGSAVAPLAFSLPVLSKSANFALLGREGAISSKLLAGVPVSTSSFVAVVYDGTLSPAASGAVYQFSGTYEAQ